MTVRSLDLKNPTDPRNYISGNGIEGQPLFWQNEITGNLRRAIHAYLDRKETEADLELVIAYIQHHIHAPMWLETYPRKDEMLEIHEIEVRELRAAALQIKTREDIQAYIRKALEAGLDPL